MVTRMTPELCYLAGLMSKGREERSAVGVKTRKDEMVERFVELAVGLGMDTKRILIEESAGLKHAYFYHSKLAKQLREIREREVKLFRFKNELAASYVAGMFDASGGVRNKQFAISGLTPSDQLMLENLGVHTNADFILNIKNFVDLVGGHSVMLKTIRPISYL